MLSLLATHPDASEQMKQGEFAVQRSKGASFSQVAVDQALKQTMNLDMKEGVGFIGFSLRQAPVQRWPLIFQVRASFSVACKQLAGISAQAYHRHHQDLGKAAICINESESSVQQVVEQVVQRAGFQLESGARDGRGRFRDVKRCLATGN